MTLPKISIIIPTLNEEKNLPRLLSSLHLLDYPQKNLEIIIVDGGSTDQTVVIAQKFGARVLNNPLKIRGAGCKIGIEKARHSLVAFTDADCVVPKNWLSKLSQYFDRPEIAAVGGPNITPKNETISGRAVGEVLKMLTTPGARYGYTGNQIVEIYHNPGCNVLYQKRAILKVGNFNRRLLTCEDEELDFRLRVANYKLLFTPQVVVEHYRRLTYRKIFVQAHRFGIGRMQAIRLHPKMARWFHFVPALVIISLVGLPLALIVFTLLAIWLSLFKKHAPVITYFLIFNSWFFGYGLGIIRGIFKPV